MEQDDRKTLLDVADALGYAASRLADLAEDDTEYGPGDAACQRVEDEARWMKGARRELAALIRDVEGPNPRPAPRRR